MPLWNESTLILPLDAFFKPEHACGVKPEVPKSWTLEMDYSRAPCLGADQKTRGLWERDWVKHKQTKTTQQQIQSHLNKVDVFRFSLVSSDATNELSSVAVKKHSQNTPHWTKQVWANIFWLLCLSRHLAIENILKSMAPQELDKVTKRNRDDNELDSPKITPLNDF